MSHPTRTRTPKPPAPACRPVARSATIASRRIADGAPTTFAPGYAPVSPVPHAAQVVRTQLMPKTAPVVVEPKPRIHPAVWFGGGVLATFLAVYAGFWIWHG
jgi:hypothetical protein